MYSEKILVNGKEYTLQHPGNRAFQKIANSSLKVSENGMVLDLTPLMDFAFEHCVIPSAGSLKLSVDGPLINGQKPSIASTTKEQFIAWQKEYEGVWVKILPSFLRGNLETFVFETDNRRSNATEASDGQTLATSEKPDLSKMGSKTRTRKHSDMEGS